jgi:hypothetical protein
LHLHHTTQATLQTFYISLGYERRFDNPIFDVRGGVLRAIEA